MPEQVRVRVLFFAAAMEAAGDVTSVDLELSHPADTALLRCERKCVDSAFIRVCTYLLRSGFL